MVVEKMSELRSRGDFVGALNTLLTERDCNPEPVNEAFRHHFLGMRDETGHDRPCLLLEGAAHGHARALLDLIDSADLDRNVRPLRSFLPAGPANLLESRFAILRAVSCDRESGTIQRHLLDAVRLNNDGVPLKPPVGQGQRLHVNPPAFLTQLSQETQTQFSQETPKKWADCLKTVQQQFSKEQSPYGTDTDWDHPALLIVGESLAYLLNRGQLPVATHKVETWVLLAVKQISDGLLGRLVFEKVPSGSGLLYPDCRYSGYLALETSFQQGLRNVMTVMRRRSDWIERKGHLFDYRWRLIPLSPKDGHRLPELLAAVSDRSAEAAFACALRALLWDERLDESVAVSAYFQDPAGDHENLYPIGGIEEKLLAVRPGTSNRELAELRRCRINEIVLHEDALLNLPSEVKVDDWTIRITRVKTFDEAYRRLSDYCQITDRYRQAILSYTRRWFAEHCSGSGDESEPTGDYIPNDFRFRVDHDSSVPFDGEPRRHLLQGQIGEAFAEFGRPAWRVHIVADSGLGKSTLLAYIAHQTARLQRDLVPIWFEQLDLLLDRSTRDGFLDAAVDQITKIFVEHHAHVQVSFGLPNREEIRRWLVANAERNAYLWLLDALDQMSAHQTRLAQWESAFPACPVLLTTRQESLRESSLRGHTLDLQPFTTETARNYLGDFADLFFHRLPVADPNEPEHVHVLTIPLVLHLLKQRAVENKIDPAIDHLDQHSFRNRFSIYHLVMNGEGGLVAKGCRSLKSRGDLRDANLQSQRRALKCLQEIAWKQIEADHFDTTVSGRLYKQLADYLDCLSNDAEDAFKQINVVTQLPAFDDKGRGGLKWRHRSFLEFFAGCKLADTPELQEQVFKQHARDPRWVWVLRFAIGAMDDEGLHSRINTVAEWLLECGAAFFLWTMNRDDRIIIRKELDDLCRWLVHCDLDSWQNRGDSSTSPRSGREKKFRPTLDSATAAILASMFGVDHPEPWNVRDSRWLNTAWQLVRDGLWSESLDVRQTCERIHESFLSEFERRVDEAARRNQELRHEDWDHRDRGLLQLVPDDWLVSLKLMPPETLESIRKWPEGIDEHGQKRTHEHRRDEFNQLLKAARANYCLCPPVGWEHPYTNNDGTRRDPYECRIGEKRVSHQLPENLELGRTPVTNLQFQAFDPSHLRFREMRWLREEETGKNALDDHPVVDVTWHQALMLCVWLTGHRKFGTFELPYEKDWEVCCRAGRDGPGEEYGIPWCDEEQRPILDATSREVFSRLSWFGANFEWEDPDEKAEMELNRNGTIPVGFFQANGFGLLDLHGQVWEWMLNDYSRSSSDWEQESEKFDKNADYICVRGGSWGDYAWNVSCSSRSWNASGARYNSSGFRLARTKSISDQDIARWLSAKIDDPYEIRRLMRAIDFFPRMEDLLLQQKRREGMSP